jgi:hypothetical protein
MSCRRYVETFMFQGFKDTDMLMIQYGRKTPLSWYMVAKITIVHSLCHLEAIFSNSSKPGHCLITHILIYIFPPTEILFAL